MVLSEITGVVGWTIWILQSAKSVFEGGAFGFTNLRVGVGRVFPARRCLHSRNINPATKAPAAIEMRTKPQIGSGATGGGRSKGGDCPGRGPFHWGLFPIGVYKEVEANVVQVGYNWVYFLRFVICTGVGTGLMMVELTINVCLGLILASLSNGVSEAGIGSGTAVPTNVTNVVCS